jgi:hypothetical protein
MVFTGAKLSDILAHSDNEIELRNEYGRRCRVISRDEALALDTDLFVGVGNLRRIRFLRAVVVRAALNAGSQTTQRLKDRSGMNIAHPDIREHRPIPGARK